MEMWPARASITNPANADIVSMMAFDIDFFFNVFLLSNFLDLSQCTIMLDPIYKTKTGDDDFPHSGFHKNHTGRQRDEQADSQTDRKSGGQASAVTDNHGGIYFVSYLHCIISGHQSSFIQNIHQLFQWELTTNSGYLILINYC